MVASFLEIAEPINFIGAQLIYLCQPLLKYSISDQHLIALAGLLEDPDQMRVFISSLREAESR